MAGGVAPTGASAVGIIGTARYGTVTLLLRYGEVFIIKRVSFRTV